MESSTMMTTSDSIRVIPIWTTMDQSIDQGHSICQAIFKCLQRFYLKYKNLRVFITFNITLKRPITKQLRKYSIILKTKFPISQSNLKSTKSTEPLAQLPFHIMFTGAALLAYPLFFMENQNNRQIGIQKMLHNFHKATHHRPSGLHHHTLPSTTFSKTQNKKWRDEDEEQANKKLQLTTTDLFLWKAHKTNEEIEATFQLINLPECHNPAAKVTLDHLGALNFPVLKYQAQQLVSFGMKMLRTTQFCTLNFTQRVTQRMMSLLAKNYNAVAYHNFSHAFYFTMLVYQCFEREFSLKHICTDEEYFYILVAGFCHDLNHNGSTNAFEIKIKSQLAQEVKNESVLENMHIRHLWKILEEHPDLNFITPAKNPTKAKEIVTRLILSTDMAFHNKNLQKFKQTRRAPGFDIKRNSEHKWATIQQVFHACDIGNPCTDYDNYIAWGALLSHEFSEVFRQEKKLQLQVTKCFEMTSVESVYKDQVWFIGCLVLPIWKQLGDLFPSFSPMTANIDSNLKRVKQQLQKLKQ